MCRLRIFRIRDEYMKEIGSCKKTLFHDHSVPDTYIFEDCKHVRDYDPELNGISVSLDSRLC